MRRQLNRLDGNSRNAALRKALERRRQATGGGGVDLDAPLVWWRPVDSIAHAAWLEAPEPIAVPYGALSPAIQWPAGQPVLLVTDGHEHRCWVRLEGSNFCPRWLPGDMPRKLVSPAALTMRNPRELWSDCWRLQVALALLSAANDPRCRWLEDPDPIDEPALADLLMEAEEELGMRAALPFIPDSRPVSSPQPPVRRAWTRRERDAMRAASSAPPEYVVLTGRGEPAGSQ